MDVTKPDRRKLEKHAWIGLCSDGKWRLRYRETGSNRDARKVLDATNAVDAEREAREYLAECKLQAETQRALATLRAQGFTVATQAERQGVNIEAALLEAMKYSKGNDVTMERYGRGINLFIRFLRAHCPEVVTWDQLKQSHVLAWVRSMEKHERARDTIRLALVPVKRAAAFWAAEDPATYRDFVKLARIRLEAPQSKVPATLSPAELESFLEWLRMYSPALWPIAVLQGMCGLRMYEAAFLRRCDVDFKAGTVTVCETPLHTPKNRKSYRTIPIHNTALEALLEYQAARKARDLRPDALVCVNARGEAWTLDSLNLAWARAMSGYVFTRTDREPTPREVGARAALGLPADFKPHNLRATFATLCGLGRCSDRVLKFYLGHSTGDILGAHYEGKGLKNTEHLRQEIVSAFAAVWADRHSEKWQICGTRAQAGS